MTPFEVFQIILIIVIIVVAFSAVVASLDKAMNGARASWWRTFFSLQAYIGVVLLILLVAGLLVWAVSIW